MILRVFFSQIYQNMIKTLSVIKVQLFVSHVLSFALGLIVNAK